MRKKNNQGLKRIILTLGVMMIAIAMSFTFVGCGSSGSDETSESVQAEQTQQSQEETTADDSAKAGQLLLEVNGETLEIEAENNSSVDALKELIGEDGLKLKLEEYGGFEKVGPLPESLPTSDEQMGVAAGDIVLYQGNQVSLLYGENSWSYTKLGHVKGITGDELHALLGDGDVEVLFSRP